MAILRLSVTLAQLELTPRLARPSAHRVLLVSTTTTAMQAQLVQAAPRGTLPPRAPYHAVLVLWASTTTTWTLLRPVTTMSLAVELAISRMKAQIHASCVVLGWLIWMATRQHHVRHANLAHTQD